MNRRAIPIQLISRERGATRLISSVDRVTSLLVFLDETRLISRQTSECYQHSTPSSSSSPPLIPVQRRRPIGNPSRMTSYSAMKRKTQRPDLARVRDTPFASNKDPSSRVSFSVKFILNTFSDWLPLRIPWLAKIDPHSPMLPGRTDWLLSDEKMFSIIIIVLFIRSTVVLYDIHQQKQDFIINQARKAITSLALSPDGRYLATGEVKILTPSRENCCGEWRCHSSLVMIPRSVFGISLPLIEACALNWVIINSASTVWWVLCCCCSSSSAEEFD